MEKYTVIELGLSPEKYTRIFGIYTYCVILNNCHVCIILNLIGKITVATEIKFLIS